MAARFKEIIKKYGKVGLGVHFSVSAASITGLYVAIKNNVDVESLFEKFNLHVLSGKEESNLKPDANLPPASLSEDGGRFVFGDSGSEQIGGGTSTSVIQEQPKKRNRTAELAASTGGALALAVLCNKALFPIRVPITMALTPPIARFLARRKIMKTGV